MNKSTKFSPKVRERAVCTVQEHRGQCPSPRAAVESIAPKISHVPNTLLSWIQRHEIVSGAPLVIQLLASIRRGGRAVRTEIGALLLLALLAFLPCEGALAVPALWTTNGHSYEAVRTPQGVDWLTAKSLAEAQGAHLATITSAEENAFVFRLIATDERFWINVGDDTRGPWLGGFQPPGSREPDGGWTWVTDEKFAYHNWAFGEPNEGGAYGPSEMYLSFHGKGNYNFANTWNDLYDFEGMRGFIVEYSVPEPPLGALCAILLAMLILRRLGRRS